MEIKQYKVENNLAVPVNPYPLFTNSNDCTNDKQSNDENWNNYNEFAKANTFHTNAQDGVYDADCFGEVEYQFTDTSFDDEWHSENEDTYERYPKYELYECHAKTLDPKYKTRQFLPFNPIPKMETTELPSPEKTIDDKFINVHELGKIAILDGQSGLPETENNFYKWLVKRNHEVLVITDLFNHPERVKALKLFDIDTVVLGTTGTYRDKINTALEAFKKLKWLPKNAVFTMGEDYFHDFLQAGVKGYKIYPMSSMYQSDDVFITEL